MTIALRLSSPHHAITAPLAVDPALVRGAWERLPHGFGRDLVEVLRVAPGSGLASLWERHGTGPIDLYDEDPERRVYVHIAWMVRHRLRRTGRKVRNGTEYRWASAIIDEQRTHPHCRASLTWRRAATESRYTQWADYLDSIYQSVIEEVIDVEQRAIAEIRRIVWREAYQQEFKTRKCGVKKGFG